MHQSSYDHCRNFVSDSLSRYRTLRIADVGSQNVNGCYRPLFLRDGWEYVGFDASPGENVDVVIAEQSLRQHAQQFDVVISGQTLEHVRKPWVWIKQVASLAKPGGLVWIIAPNTFHYHEYPIDCWRVWPDGLRALFDEAGLIVDYARMVGIDTYGLARKAPDASYMQE